MYDEAKSTKQLEDEYSHLLQRKSPVKREVDAILHELGHKAVKSADTRDLEPLLRELERLKRS